MRTHPVAAGAVLALALPALAAAEDLTIVSKVTIGSKGTPITATTYLSADKVRSTRPASEGRSRANGQRASMASAGSETRSAARRSSSACRCLFSAYCSSAPSWFSRSFLHCVDGSAP